MTARTGTWLHRPTIILGALLMAGAGGCSSRDTPRPVVEIGSTEEEPGWSRLLREEDAARLQMLANAWSAALTSARRSFGRRVGGEGALLMPDAAQPRAALPPGSYRCRLVRIGGENRRRAFAESGPFFCHVGDEGELLSFTQQDGSERPGGYLHEDGRDRMVFIGALARGRERSPPAYGDDRERDIVGILERIGPLRFRLVLPRGEDRVDLLELVPAPAQ